MTTLVIGASGCLGGILYAEFGKLGPVSGTYCSHPVDGLIHLDITDPGEVRAVLDRVQPQLVLQPAAQPNVEGCEENPAESYRVNVAGTRNVVQALRGSSAKLVFFSTDYVFDGTAGPYAEDDPPSPIQVYGRHKLEAERLIQETLPNHLILRVHGVFGWERQGKNFVMRLIQTLRHGKTMAVPSDQMGSPTYAPNLSDALRELVAMDARGIYHITGSTFIDRYSFARLIAEVFALDASRIIPKTTAELGQKAPRPLKSWLGIDKARRELRTRLWSAEEALRDMRNTAPAA